jgi:hypothetical protein
MADMARGGGESLGGRQGVSGNRRCGNHHRRDEGEAQEREDLHHLFVLSSLAERATIDR